MSGAARPTGPDAAPGLYVHLPWCVRKCPYCDFNSHEWRDGELPVARYTDALLADLERERATAGDGWRPFASVFFGGGTPSLFPAAQIERVLAAVRAAFGIADGAEITLEANPGAVERGAFGEMRAAGVNRISLGAQSFDAEALRRIGRIHGPQDVYAAVDELRAAGIDAVNLDLMYGLPGQSLTDAVNDARALLELAPGHLSHYQLTLEPNTLFHAHPPTLPDEDTLAAMQADCQDAFAGAGYEHYEVSAYGHAGARGRHNLNYWRFGDYLGIGAGAHGKRTVYTAGVIERSVRERHPRRYMERVLNGDEIVQRRTPDTAELVFEYALNVLRLVDEPLDLQAFATRCLQPPDCMHRPVHLAVERNLLAPAGAGRYVSTALGRRFLNDLQALFLPADSAV